MSSFAAPVHLKWEELVAAFETTSTPRYVAPGPIPATTVVPNITLEQDKQTLLRLWKAMGGDEEKLRRGHGEDNEGEDLDDVSKWKWIWVEGGRVTELHWVDQGLSGTIPAKIGALSALTFLSLSGNDLSGELPSELGNLTSLAALSLMSNSFSGAVPSSLANLTNLSAIDLSYNNFTTDVPPSYIIDDKEKVQTYLYTALRRPTIRYVITCIITTNCHPLSKPIHPLFTFLSNNEDVTITVLSFLGDEEVEAYRVAKLY